jgi:hypothetical protein
MHDAFNLPAKGMGAAEAWSQKYKSSINCSHPKGFSQKAHCAGKKKHEESMMTMEAVCPDCGMCQTHGNLNEIKKGAKDSNGFTKCWPGHHAAGTKKGKNGGQVRNCVPNESLSEGWGMGGYETAKVQPIEPGKGIDKEIGENPDWYNDEANSMSTAQLKSLVKHATKLRHAVKQMQAQGDTLEPWQQSKVTKAADYLDAVFNAVDDEHDMDEEEGAGGMLSPISEAPIDMDPSEPMNPMIYGHQGVNPAKLKDRMMRAAGQLKDLAQRAESGSALGWESITRHFEELAMNIEQIRHALEELANKRKKGGIGSRGIDPHIGESDHPDEKEDKALIRKMVKAQALKQEDSYMAELQAKLAEKIPKNAPVDVYIKDFEKSNAPQFRGKTKEKRRQMAIAASYGAKNPSKKKK